MLEVAVLAAAASALGLGERLALDRARALVPVRVHVNGSRGKSTVTRLIAGALRAAGARTLGKVTGTDARWLLPDGADEPVRRRFGFARIQEQATAVRRAASLGCQALVVECMAVRPELQWVSEHRMIRSTLGVITNVRQDHGEVMGQDRPQIARSLANTIPVRGVLVVGDPAAFELLEAEALRRGTRAVLAPPLSPDQAPADLQQALAWHAPENLGTAMAAARLLGIGPQAAWRGLAQAVPEPGTASWCVVELEGCGRAAASGAAARPAAGLDRVGWPTQAVLVDALAANDPESLERVLVGLFRTVHLPPATELHLVYHHRADRVERAVRFGRWIRDRLPEVLRALGLVPAVNGLPAALEGPPVAPEAVSARAPAGARVGLRTWATGDPGGARFLRAWAQQGPPEPGSLLRAWGVRAWALGGDVQRPRRALVIVACGNTRGARGWQKAFGPWRPVPLSGLLPLEEVGEGARHG